MCNVVPAVSSYITAWSDSFEVILKTALAQERHTVVLDFDNSGRASQVRLGLKKPHVVPH